MSAVAARRHRLRLLARLRAAWEWLCVNAVVIRTIGCWWMLIVTWRQRR